MEIRILSDAELDAIAGGQATATTSFSLSAAGASVAAVAATVDISTSDTDDTKLASITGNLSSTSD